jgi:hypothetical protein
MDTQEFECLLDAVTAQLTSESHSKLFTSSKEFENRVREVVQAQLNDSSMKVDFDPHPQAFPDIALEEFGIEVKFTTQDTWRSVANSVLERMRVDSVKKIYIVFGKMGGDAEVKWAEYEKSVIHVRTSHVPRFEVEVFPLHSESLFDLMGIRYDDFRSSQMEEKMLHIRRYARNRLEKGERLWWLDDTSDSSHTLPIQARLYTKISTGEKLKLRAEAVLLCPSVVKSSRTRDKYDDVVLYILTYHGVLCHQARDLFTAGSVADPNKDKKEGINIQKSIALIEDHIVAAADRLDDELFIEYWGYAVKKELRIAEWLKQADALAVGWTPSKCLFKNSV